MKIKAFLFTCIFHLSTLTFAQLSVPYLGAHKDVEQGTTYLILKNPEAEENVPYLKILDEYWTFTPLKVIQPSQVHDRITYENSFLNLYYAWGEDQGEIKSYYTKFSLRLWKATKRYAKKKNFNRINFGIPETKTFAQVKLYADAESRENPKFLEEVNFDGGGKFKNWGLGFFKNYIQAMNDHLINHEYQPQNNKIKNKSELKKLKNDTLYIPDWILKKDHLDYVDSTLIDPNVLFQFYPYEYQLIDGEELDEMILSSPTSFYYLNYVPEVGCTFISIINSLTGERIYYKNRDLSNSISRIDFRGIAELIESIE